MDIKKIVLYIIIAVLAVMLINAWMKDNPTPKEKAATASAQTTKAKQSEASAYSPETFSPGVAAKTKKAAAAPATAGKTPQNRLIDVKTDVLDVSIDSKGGNIISAKLLKYPVSLEEKNVPMQILNSNPDELYLAQSGLTNTGKNGQAAAVQFTTTSKNYALQEGQNRLVIVLKGRTENGLTVNKTNILKRDD